LHVFREDNLEVAATEYIKPVEGWQRAGELNSQS